MVQAILGEEADLHEHNQQNPKEKKPMRYLKSIEIEVIGRQDLTAGIILCPRRSGKAGLFVVPR